MKSIDNSHCVFYMDVNGKIRFLEIKKIGFDYFLDDFKYLLVENTNPSTRNYCKEIFQLETNDSNKDYRQKPFTLIPYQLFNEGINHLLHYRLNKVRDTQLPLSQSDKQYIRDLVVFRDNVEKALLDYFSNQC